MLELTLVTFTLYGMSALWIKFSDITKLEHEIELNKDELIKTMNNKNKLIHNILEKKEASIIELTNNLIDANSILEKTVGKLEDKITNVNQKLERMDRNEYILQSITKDITHSRTTRTHPQELAREFNEAMRIKNPEIFLKFRGLKHKETKEDLLINLCEVCINSLSSNKNWLAIGKHDVHVFNTNAFFVETGSDLLIKCMGILEIL